MHQLSIYSTYKDSTACAEYDFWTSIGRVVKRGEHGIPLLDVSGNQARVKYIFDVSQTVSIGNKISEIKLWKYDSKKHLPAIDHLIDSFKEKNSSLIFSQNEDEQRAIESVFYTHPVTGERGLDGRQMNYKYEWFDYTAAALRRNRLDPAERERNTNILPLLPDVPLLAGLEVFQGALRHPQGLAL